MERAAKLEEDELRRTIERARRGDPDAWERLYRHSYQRLFAFALRRLRDQAAAEDAVSDTMVRAIDRIGTFQWEGAGFDAWLYGILRNVVLESHRAASRSPLSGQHLVWPEVGAEVIDLTEPSDRLLNHIESVAVRSAFHRLEPHEQEILELRVIGSLSAEDVGTVIGKQAGAVRMAQSRALTHLRILMREFNNA